MYLTKSTPVAVLCKPIKPSKSPGRRGFTPDPIGGANNAPRLPIWWEGECTSPSKKNQPSWPFMPRFSSLTISVDAHNVVDGLAPMPWCELRQLAL